MKNFELPLTQEISRQPKTDCVTWLLVITLTQITMKLSKGATRRQSAQFEGKRSTGKCNAGTKSCVQGKEKVNNSQVIN